MTDKTAKMDETDERAEKPRKSKIEDLSAPAKGDVKGGGGSAAAGMGDSENVRER